MKAYFYCRVAHDDSFSLERQAEELRRYAEQAGYTIVGAAAEHGSGMTLDRPALQEVMEDVLAGKVDVVLILSLIHIWARGHRAGARVHHPRGGGRERRGRGEGGSGTVRIV